MVGSFAMRRLAGGLLHFDKPFGSFRHYLVIFVWGFGAQAGLEALATGIDRFIVKRSAPSP